MIFNFKNMILVKQVIFVNVFLLRADEVYREKQGDCENGNAGNSGEVLQRLA
jgi:hypothetical protein